MIVEFGPVDLSAEHLELVAQHDDLEVLGPSRADEEPSEYGEDSVEDAEHNVPGWRHRGWSAPTREFPSPHRIA